MVEPRKIVLILGNGFDLDLGLKTSYKDFWESDFCPKDYPAPLIHHLNQRWDEDLSAVKWYDLENELMEYYQDIANPSAVEDFITEEEREFLKIFEPYKWDYGMYNDKVDIVQSLVDKHVILVANKVIRQLYVPYREDIFKSPVWRDRKALQLIKEGLCKYLGSLGLIMQASKTIAFQVLAFLDEEARKGDFVNVYSFNYTRVLLNGRKPDAAKVHYMHGSCEDGKIIIGTRDDKEFCASYDFLQKSFDPSYNPPALVANLQDADEIVIFGHSIGENDRHYFKAFFTQQTNYAATRRKDITIFTRNSASEIQIKRSLQSMTDGNLSTLFGLNNLQIIKTGDIKEDQEKLLNFLMKHGKEELATREFIGKLLAKESA